MEMHIVFCSVSRLTFLSYLTFKQNVESIDFYIPDYKENILSEFYLLHVHVYCIVFTRNREGSWDLSY